MSNESELLGALFGEQDAKGGGGRGFKYSALDSSGKAAYDRAYNAAINEMQLNEIRKSNKISRINHQESNRIEREYRDRQISERLAQQKEEEKRRQIAIEKRRVESEKTNAINQYIGLNFRKFQKQILTITNQNQVKDYGFNHLSKLILFGMLLDFHLNKERNSHKDIPIPFLESTELNKYIDLCSQILTKYENVFHTTPKIYFDKLTSRLSKLVFYANQKFIVGLSRLTKLRSKTSVVTYRYPNVVKVKHFMEKYDFKNDNLWGNKGKYSIYKTSAAILKSKNEWQKIKESQYISFVQISEMSNEKYKKHFANEVERHRIKNNKLTTQYESWNNLHDNTDLIEIEQILDLINDSHSNLNNLLMTSDSIHFYPEILVDCVNEHFNVLKQLYSKRDDFLSHLLSQEVGLIDTLKCSNIKKLEKDLGQIVNKFAQPSNIDDYKMCFFKSTPNDVLRQNIIDIIIVNLASLFKESFSNTNSSSDLIADERRVVIQDLATSPILREINNYVLGELVLQEGKATQKAINQKKNSWEPIKELAGVVFGFWIMLAFLGTVFTKFGWIDSPDSMLNWFTAILFLGLLWHQASEYIEYIKFIRFTSLVRQDCKSIWLNILDDLSTRSLPNDIRLNNKLANLKLNFSELMIKPLFQSVKTKTLFRSAKTKVQEDDIVVANPNDQSNSNSPPTSDNEGAAEESKVAKAPKPKTSVNGVFVLLIKVVFGFFALAIFLKLVGG